MSLRQDVLEARRKKLIVFAIITAVIFVSAMFIYYLRPVHKKPPKPVKTLINTSQLTQQEWIAKSSVQLSTQQEKIDKLQKQITLMKKALEKQQKKMAQNSNVPTTPTKTTKTTNALSVFSRVKAKEGRGGENRYVKYPPSPATVFRGKKMPKKSKQVNQQITTPQAQVLNNIIVVAKPAASTAHAHETSYVKVKPKNKKPKNKIIIPAGSFVKAVLLDGADVPTMGNGDVGPIPVILRIDNLAQLPNLWKANIKSCFLVGSAKGSLASERAYIKVAKLSCVDDKGKAVTTHIQGYITGEDGKVGLNGRVVSKQGSMLARTLIAGFLQGVGQAFSQSQTDISISPLGSTNSVAPDTSTLARYSVGGGVSKATEQLAKFYMKMANQMFPVIEINAGRAVDVVFLNDVKIGGKP